jgi:hypothetical protein
MGDYKYFLTEFHRIIGKKPYEILYNYKNIN